MTSHSSTGPDRQAKLTATPLPEFSVSEFQCETVIVKPRIDKAKARSLIADEILRTKLRPPGGLTPDDLLDNIHAFLLPHWLLKAAVSSQWQAVGIRKEGVGQVSPNAGQRTKERGTARVEFTQFVPNGVFEASRGDCTHEPADAAEILSEADKAYLRCLQPLAIDKSATADTLRLQRKLHLERAVEQQLAHYDEVEGVTLDDLSLVTDRVQIQAWLHPVYISWFESKDTTWYIVCDAVTGRVDLPVLKGWSVRSATVASSRAVGHAVGHTIRALAGVTFLFLICGMAIVYVTDKFWGNKPAPVQPGYGPATPPIAAAPPPPPIVATGPAATYSPELSPGSTPRPSMPSVTVPDEVEQDDADSQPARGFNPAVDAGFPCDRATTQVEELICSNETLALLDATLSEKYRDLLSIAENKKALRREQRRWLKDIRDKCSAVDCIASAYRDRIEQLDDVHRLDR